MSFRDLQRSILELFAETAPSVSTRPAGWMRVFTPVCLWKERNKEHVKAYQREWKQRNREHVNAYQREYMKRRKAS